MSFELLVGPPGSGKTTRLLERAREAATLGRRVWWVGLPSQRTFLYRRATEAGALLGLEFLSSQQVYYRLLAAALALKPLVVGTGRLALVGEALLEVRGDLPSPGEARLFAQAIAEAKRFGLGPDAVETRDPETDRFARVFAAYEALKGEGWDYDDFRLGALALAERMEHRGEADVIVVDGFREIGPLELRLYRALARHAEVWLALPEPPPGETPTAVLTDARRTRLERYRAANPVAEARWVLRALKRDLALGLDPLELAVILPEGAVRAFGALADEYGVPTMDETPKALADTLPGRLLMDLLELPDHPTASRLLAIPELQGLANAALERKVAGLEAIGVLAEREGLAAPWRKWRELLGPAGDEMSWARRLVENGLPALRRELLEREELGFARFKEHALQRAKEASSLAKGEHFRAWWAALLQETFVFDRPRGGVALLTMKLVSGRRFRRAYLLRAVEGSYTTREAEDYFVPEEARRSLAASFETLGLPKRFLGRDRALVAELLSRADELTVTVPDADQNGPLAPDPALLGGAPAELPELPAASRLELADEAHYRAERGALPLGRPTLERLRRYSECAFRSWAESALPDDEPTPWWRELIDELRAHGRLSPARLEELRMRFPDAAGWLADRAERLLALSYGVSLPDEGIPAAGVGNEGGDGSARAYLDAAGRRGGEVTFYRFVAPGAVAGSASARKLIEARWTELWAAGYMLERYRGRVTRVYIGVWPVLGEPHDAYPDGIDVAGRLVVTRRRKAARALERFSRGLVEPNPGFHCRECRVFDVCREGTR